MQEVRVKRAVLHGMSSGGVGRLLCEQREGERERERESSARRWLSNEESTMPPYHTGTHPVRNDQCRVVRRESG